MIMAVPVHDDCAAASQYDTRAHTHEGQTGWWVFASEKAAEKPAPDPAMPADLGRRASVTVDRLAWELNQAGVSQELLTRMAQLAADIRAELAGLRPAATDGGT
jgi:hypothetical protein